MNGYSISKLARDAGVSVHVVRDYAARGLLRPVERTASGYNIYGAQTLARLRFVRAAFEAGIGLPELTQLCHALDHGAGDTDEYLARLRSLIAARRSSLALIDRQLTTMAGGTRPRAAAENSRAQSR